MGNNSNLSRAIRRALLAGLVMSTATVNAQETGAAGTNPLEEVVITGSRLIRRDFAAVSPVQTIDIAEIQASGNVTLEDTLNKYPQLKPDNTGTTNQSGGTGVLSANLRSYEAVMSDEKAISSLEFQALITLTKVQASELAVTTVLSSLRACGLSGYRNDTEFTIGRLLRDVLSAPLMINNDRILTNLATTSLMTPLPTSISG